jgi:hypothetical protein
MRFHRSLAWILIATVLVGNATCVQMAAWASMLVARSTTEGVSAAITSTFDGSRPCSLCKAADALERADKPVMGDKQPVGKKMVKTCDLLAAEPFALECRPAVAAWLEMDEVADRVAQHRPRPDVPPPRA